MSETNLQTHTTSVTTPKNKVSTSGPIRQIGLKPWAWWLLLGVTSVCLSHSFEAFKVFTLDPNLSTLFPLLLWIILTTLSLTMMVYDGYAKDKSQGKLVRQFGPFEWLYARQA